MKRFLLFALFPMLVAGVAAAQPPVDYELVCSAEDVDDVVIGAVSLVDGKLHVALVEDWSCAGTMWVGEFEADLDEVGGVWILTIGDLELSAEVKVLPAVAVAGMLQAQENRTAAFENSSRGELEAAAADERKPEGLPEAAGGGRP